MKGIKMINHSVFMLTIILLVGCGKDDSVTATLSVNQIHNLIEEDKTFQYTIEFAQEKNTQHKDNNIYLGLFRDLGLHEFHKFYAIAGNKVKQNAFIDSMHLTYDNIIQSELSTRKLEIDRNITSYKEMVTTMNPYSVVNILYAGVDNKRSSDLLVEFVITPVNMPISSLVFRVGSSSDKQNSASLKVSDVITKKTSLYWEAPEFIKNNLNLMFPNSLKINIVSAMSNGKNYSEDIIEKSFPHLYNILKLHPKSITLDVYRNILNSKYNLQIPSRNEFTSSQLDKHLIAINDLAYDYYKY